MVFLHILDGLSGNSRNSKNSKIVEGVKIVPRILTLTVRSSTIYWLDTHRHFWMENVIQISCTAGTRRFAFRPDSGYWISPCRSSDWVVRPPDSVELRPARQYSSPALPVGQSDKVCIRDLSRSLSRSLGPQLDEYWMHLPETNNSKFDEYLESDFGILVKVSPCSAAN